MKIILLANYLPDQQESMQRYVALLERRLQAAGQEVEVIRPRAFFGRLKPSGRGIGKWLGYIDKFVLFRWELHSHLRRHQRRGKKYVVHICDHSNAMYVPWLRTSALVTCHDLLAIKSALGLVPQNRTGWSGRILQRWILQGLRRASFVVCDSTATRDDLLSLAPHLKDRSEVVDLPLTYPFAPLPFAEVVSHLTALGDRRLFNQPGEPASYLFHVGGNQWYKNREGLLRIFAQLKRNGAWPRLKLVMAGKAPTPSMENFVSEQGFQDEVIFLTAVSDAQLNALYRGAKMLLYPSLQEGFGWPPLEAQASGCLVVTSNRAPMNQIGGPAAFYADPANESTFVRQITQVLQMDADQISTRQAQAELHASSYQATRFLEKMLAVYAGLSR